MKKLFLTFFMISNAFAGFRINDPNGLLTTVDTYLNAYSFDTAFQVGDIVNYEHRECTFIKDESGNHSANCFPAVIHKDKVLEKYPDRVVILNHDHTDHGESKMTLTRDAFEQANGNYLRIYLNTYSNQSDLENIEANIEKISFENYSVGDAVIQAIRVFYTINLCQKVSDTEDECFILPEEMLLGRNILVLAQLLEHVPNRLVSERTYTSKIIDFTRE